MSRLPPPPTEHEWAIPLPTGASDREPVMNPVPQSEAAPCDPLSLIEFRRRVEEELPYLRRAARHWQREKAGAEDLVHDTVLRALANAQLFEAGSNLRAWLLTIMRNRFFASAAASSRWVAMPNGVAEAYGDAAPHPSDGRLQLRDLERALGRLPQKQRAAVLAVGRDGQSYAEAARAMGTTVAALRCHLKRARDRLRAAVEGRDERTWFAVPTPPIVPTNEDLAAPPQTSPAFGGE
jgi:RNA polymerase sigma-70 factor (ECF subfamily)